MTGPERRRRTLGPGGAAASPAPARPADPPVASDDAGPDERTVPAPADPPPVDAHPVPAQGTDHTADADAGRDSRATAVPAPAAPPEDEAGAPPARAAVPAPAASPDGAATGEPDRAARPGKPARNGAAVATGTADETGTADGTGESETAGKSGEPDGAGAADGDEAGGAAAGDGRFTVVLENFEGPFDLLLQLISKHRLDVTEVALSRVTDEFMAYIHAMGPDFDLDQTTEFLVVAATLLDLKAARLLPAAQVEDEADLALLEARDLLFARLLQYRAFKTVADIFADRLAAESLRHPRTVGLEPHHAELLPDVVISIGPEGFARLAVKAMQPKPKPQVYVDHIHAPLVSVREQAEVVIARLRELGDADFTELTRDAPDTLTVVARFLALLELYRERAVELDQAEALGRLVIRWRGGTDARPVVTDEFDQETAPDDGADGRAAGPPPATEPEHRSAPPPATEPADESTPEPEREPA